MRVPQHKYRVPGLSLSHSVLGSQQRAGYLGTRSLPPKSKCLSAKGIWRTEAEARVEGTAITRRGCMGCVSSLGDFQE